MLVVTSEKRGDAQRGEEEGGGEGGEGGHRNGRKLSFHADEMGVGEEGSSRGGREFDAASPASGGVVVSDRSTLDAAAQSGPVGGPLGSSLQVVVGTESTSASLIGGLDDAARLPVANDYSQPLLLVTSPGDVRIEGAHGSGCSEGAGLKSASNGMWAHSPGKNAVGSPSNSASHFGDDAITSPILVAPPPTPSKDVTMNAQDMVRGGRVGGGGGGMSGVDEVFEELMSEFDNLSVLTEAAIKRWNFPPFSMPSPRPLN